jgi:hypothetical protein
MKPLLAFLLFLIAFQATSQTAATSQSVTTSMLRTRLRNNELAPGGRFAPTSPADTVVARQFLEAVADTLVSDSIVVARFMCPALLFRKHEPHTDTVVALLRESLYFLRVGLVRALPAVRRSRLISFQNLPQKPPFELAGGIEGAYVLLEGEQPRLCLLVRRGRVAAFSLSFYEGPQRAHFRDYCR